MSPKVLEDLLLKQKLWSVFSSLQRDLLCKQMDLSSSISQDAFEEAVYERIGKDDFVMDALRW